MSKIKYFFILLVFIISCKREEGASELRKAEGGVFFGGIFRINEPRYFRSLFPLSVTESTSHRIIKQTYEGLVKLNQSDLTIQPAIAEKWERNIDATQWVFDIRKGVKFQDDSCFKEGIGREVTAYDIKYCFERLCTNSPENKQFEISFKNRVVGANEYYESTLKNTPLEMGVSGIKVINDYKIQIDLSNPFAGFLNILVTPGCFIYPKEAYEKYGNDMATKCVGTGAFQLNKITDINKPITFKRNPKYWGIDAFGNRLPYLDSLKISFVEDKSKEIDAFRKDSLEMVFQLPSEMMSSIMDEIEHSAKNKEPFKMQVTPAMATFYYGFQNEGKIFNNMNVRLAFNYAIDREYIVNKVLNGDGIPANFGIVPPSLKFYDSKSIVGFTLDIKKAKAYLANGGFPEGKGFPRVKIVLNTGGNQRNVLVAEAVIQMLKENLNIDLELTMIPYTEYLEAMESGSADMWKTGWIADYPDPESFLNLLYSKNAGDKPSEKSILNYMRYKSERFDSYFLAAMSETDTKKRMDRYLQADQIAINEAAVMPIFYDENYRLIKTNIKNFPANAMEYRDLSSVYFVPKDYQQTEKGNEKN